MKLYLFLVNWILIFCNYFRQWWQDFHQFQQESYQLPSRFWLLINVWLLQATTMIFTKWSKNIFLQMFLEPMHRLVTITSCLSHKYLSKYIRTHTICLSFMVSMKSVSEVYFSFFRSDTVSTEKLWWKTCSGSLVNMPSPAPIQLLILGKYLCLNYLH